MKKFIVLRKCGTFGMSEERSFEEIDDAVAFAGLLNKSNENEYVTFHIAQLLP